MNPFKVKDVEGAEAKIQAAIIKKLREHEWFVKVMFGNMFQSGMPDLFAAHPKYGQKWIEVKNPKGFSFTDAQRIYFPRLIGAGVSIWVLFSARDDEILKLFRPGNFQDIYMRYCHGMSKMSGYDKDIH